MLSIHFYVYQRSFYSIRIIHKLKVPPFSKSNVKQPLLQHQNHSSSSSFFILSHKSLITKASCHHGFTSTIVQAPAAMFNPSSTSGRRQRRYHQHWNDYDEHHQIWHEIHYKIFSHVPMVMKKKSMYLDQSSIERRSLVFDKLSMARGGLQTQSSKNSIT